MKKQKKLKKKELISTFHGVFISETVFSDSSVLINTKYEKFALVIGPIKRVNFYAFEGSMPKKLAFLTFDPSTDDRHGPT